jgi:hypothetical protein
MKKHLILSACLIMAISSFAQKKDFSYKFYGQIRTDLYYNSRANEETVDGLFYMYPKDEVFDSNGRDYCHVGQWTLVQSGCRISKDVPPYSIMAGNPVEYHGVNAVVLQQHKNTSERVLRHIANAYRLIYQGNFSLQDAVQKIIDQVPMSEEIENIVAFVKESKRGIVK